MQRSGKLRPEDMPLLDGGIEYQVKRNSMAGPMLAVVALVGLSVLYAERAQVSRAIAGAQAYIHSSWSHSKEATSMETAATAPQGWHSHAAARDSTASRTRIKNTARMTGGIDSAPSIRADVVIQAARSAHTSAGPASDSVVHAIAVVKLADNTTMQIIDEPLPDDCHAEQHADCADEAVRWGLGNKARSPAECCRQCKHFKPGRGGHPCNAWVYCGHPDSNGVCWNMDIHTHTAGDCWLKFQANWDGNTDLSKSNLVVNHRQQFDAAFRKEHKTAPELVPWVAGVIAQQQQQ